jgi:hypothetical protein
MASKPILPNDQQDLACQVSARAWEDAYLKSLRDFEDRKSRCPIMVHFAGHGCWDNVSRGADSALSLFPSGTKVHEIIHWGMWQASVSVADAIESDWHAVGKDLYSAIVKDRIKAHNCGQYSFSFEPEPEPEPKPAASR